jgi:hypothetical protein
MFRDLVTQASRNCTAATYRKILFYPLLVLKVIISLFICKSKSMCRLLRLPRMLEAAGYSYRSLA